MSSFREGIMLDLLEAVVGVAAIRGAIDDVPFDYAKPPSPRPSHGKAYQPFAYLYEGPEQPNFDAMTNTAICTLPVGIEVTFEYSTTNGANGLMPIGRALLADVQRAVMADPNRGWADLPNGDRAKRAQRTVETLSNIEEAIGVGKGLGVVVLKLNVDYVRNAQEPAAR